jgi:hypothetical protein
VVVVVLVVWVVGAGAVAGAVVAGAVVVGATLGVVTAVVGVVVGALVVGVGAGWVAVVVGGAGGGAAVVVPCVVVVLGGGVLVVVDEVVGSLGAVPVGVVAPAGVVVGVEAVVESRPDDESANAPVAVAIPTPRANVNASTVASRLRRRTHRVEVDTAARLLRAPVVLCAPLRAARRDERVLLCGAGERSRARRARADGSISVG